MIAEQLDFKHAYLSINARGTSREAADKALGRSGSQRRRVYEFIVSTGGATDEELAEALGMNPSSVRPRRLELITAGFIRESGRTRKTASGTPAIVWVEND